MNLLFLIALVASSEPSFVAPVVTALNTGPVFSAGSTNTFWPVTNAGCVASSNVYANAAQGAQYSVVWPSNVTQTGFENQSPAISGFLGGQTVWVGPGVFRGRLSYLENGRAKAATVAVSCGTNTFSGSFLSFSNYTGSTLGAACVSNLWTLTNSRPSDRLYLSSSSVGWVWNTNCLLYGVTGFSGLSQVSALGGTLGKFTLITPRHAYTAGHTANSGRVYFVGRDGATNAADTLARFINTTNGDYCLVIFSNALPVTVEPVRCAYQSTVEVKHPPVPAVSGAPVVYLETCQHGYVGSQTCVVGSGHVMHQGGDSGNPRFIVVSNTIVNYNGTSGTLLSSNFMADLNALTVGAGLATNDYQPSVWTLGEYPTP